MRRFFLGIVAILLLIHLQSFASQCSPSAVQEDANTKAANLAEHDQTQKNIVTKKAAGGGRGGHGGGFGGGHGGGFGGGRGSGGEGRSRGGSGSSRGRGGMLPVYGAAGGGVAGAAAAGSSNHSHLGSASPVAHSCLTLPLLLFALGIVVIRC